MQKNKKNLTILIIILLLILTIIWYVVFSQKNPWKIQEDKWFTESEKTIIGWEAERAGNTNDIILKNGFSNIAQ